MTRTDAATIRDEIALITRSLEDARREHASGELDDAALAEIERRDGERLAEATARLATIEPAPDVAGVGAPDAVAPRPRRRSRRLLLVGLGCMAAAAAVLATAAADPFATPPPPPHLTRAAEVNALLANCELLVGDHHPLRALTACDAALRLAPRNPEALVESAWLRYEFAGLGERDPRQTALGFAALRRAVRVAPTSAGAHLYYGIALLRSRGGRAAAKAQLLRAAALPESADEQALTELMLSYVARR